MAGKIQNKILIPECNKLYRNFFVCLFILNTTQAFSQPSDYMKAKAFEIKNLPDSAIAYYSKILLNKNNDSKILILRGNIYYKKKLFNEALTDYNLANKNISDISDIEIAKCYARLNDEPNAIKYLKKHLASTYKLPQVEIRLEKAFAKFENTDDWKDLWKTDWYDKYDSQTSEARFMFDNKDWLGVINYLSDVLKENSRHHELFYFRAKSYFELGNYNSAISDYNLAINANKRNSEYYSGRAEVYTKLGKKKDAVADYALAITSEPANFQCYISKAELELALNKYEAAKNDIETYLNLFENDTSAIFLAGQIEFASGNYFGALGYFNKLIKINPLKTEYLLARAASYKITNLIPNALKDYNEILFIEPTNAIALCERGKIYLIQDDKKEACADWKKSMNLGNYKSNDLYLDNCK